MNDDLYLLALMTAATLAGVLTALAATFILNKKKEEEKKYVTVVKCPNCGYEEKREWREGDFVGMVEGPCPKCGGMRVVWNIYLEDREEERPKGEP
ncbi:hypothetical protein [Ignicoccus hospitalis]|uniref:Uncharacterized protein n=1 Tax=Ignicoccus hospitalis (strain KIN4/I / DSM 18386 / JCM 14125) TaxID=453591 RepID=A8A9S4_IGNH4|nr:hypothetical protein [Ignicoccus hospitalis]ABU81676.1 hypothetical protein Igni_0493 [Ignicoccus hospitalis KIN4/I]HIH89793.1 hypothetical protein [Desulfurococcaceae archaeon]